MARAAKAAPERRNEILDVAERLFAREGYANGSVQAIIDAVGIAKGTFYHHFSSKAELLEALVGRINDQLLALVSDLPSDPELTALAKLHAFFHRIDDWKVSHKELLLGLQTAFNDDSNARMHKRLRETTNQTYAPVVAAIVEQGVREGVFDTAFPTETAQIVLHVLASLSQSFTDATSEPPGDLDSLAARMDAANDAHTIAIERVLGAERGSVHLIDRETLLQWAAAIDARRAS